MGVPKVVTEPTSGGFIDSVEHDDRLVEMARGGDESAYRRLVERHQDRIVGVTLRLLKNRDEAIEAAQDVFVRAWRSLGRFEKRSRVSTWLHRIALNVCYDRLGVRKRKNEVPLDDLLAGGFEPGDEAGGATDDSVIDAQSVREFEEAVAALDETYRVIFVLRQVEGRPYEEIAGALGISVGNAKVRVHRAREMIVTALKRRGVL
ncbi:MAG TPA: RNA polymerase sigma factor [Candidatus Eisenbacteria bacterium]